MVEFIGSYTDPRYIELIMSLGTEIDLTIYLARADIAKYRELRAFFGCLVRVLEYLYKQNVRYKDIKPGNILVYSRNMLFTDFGLLFDFADADSSTTVSIVNGITSRYCTPEIAALEPRNTSSDIWSLGIIFLEIITVLKGKTVEFVYEFLELYRTRLKTVRINRAALVELIAEIEEIESIADNRALEWV